MSCGRVAAVKISSRRTSLCNFVVAVVVYILFYFYYYYFSWDHLPWEQQFTYNQCLCNECMIHLHTKTTYSPFMSHMSHIKRKNAIPIMRKLSSGLLFSIHTFYSIQWFCKQTLKALIILHKHLCSPITHSLVSNDSVSGQWMPW